MFKQDLTFRKPLMNAAGTLALTPDLRGLGDLGGLLDNFGAFVTNPLSLRPRAAAAQPALIEFPGGFLLHTGLPNPGFHAALKRYARRWSDSPLPIIVHLMADRPEETQQMVRQLEDLENVAAVELGFAPLLADDIILLVLEMCLGELPLIFSLQSEQVLSLGPRLIQNGAAAISLSAPRGALPSPSPEKKGELISGRLFGPALLPRALEAVRSAAKLGLPIIGSGGAYSKEAVAAMLMAGALGVQMEAALWLPGESKRDS